MSSLWSKDSFLWQLRERGKVREGDLIFTVYLQQPSTSSCKNRLPHYSPSPSLVMSSLFAQILLISLPHPLPLYPLHTSPSVYLYPLFSKSAVSPVSSHSHSRGIHSRVWHQALLGWGEGTRWDSCDRVCLCMHACLCFHGLCVSVCEWGRKKERGKNSKRVAKQEEGVQEKYKFIFCIDRVRRPIVGAPPRLFGWIISTTDEQML